MDRLKLAAILIVLVTGCHSAEDAAASILHPDRRSLVATPVLPYEEISFGGEGNVPLRGWLFRATPPRRGMIVYLHGSGSNRGEGIGLAQRFVPLGWDLLEFDQRGHGESGGDVCTFGVLEKRDVSHALDAVHAESAILFGSSLGASVALQTAAIDPRVRGVIADTPFSDLQHVALDDWPSIVPNSFIRAVFAQVEKQGGFKIEDASALKAAAAIHVPVLLIHGKDDKQVTPSHSQLIYAALHEPKQLVLVDGANRWTTLRGGAIWTTIDQWLAARVP